MFVRALICKKMQLLLQGSQLVSNWSAIHIIDNVIVFSAFANICLQLVNSDTTNTGTWKTQRYSLTTIFGRRSTTLRSVYVMANPSVRPSVSIFRALWAIFLHHVVLLGPGHVHVVKCKGARILLPYIWIYKYYKWLIISEIEKLTFFDGAPGSPGRNPTSWTLAYLAISRSVLHL